MGEQKILTDNNLPSFWRFFSNIKMVQWTATKDSTPWNTVLARLTWGWNTLGKWNAFSGSKMILEGVEQHKNRLNILW